MTLDAPKSITANFANPAPTVLSVNRTNASPTNAASVQFTVTLSESVTGLSNSNFTLVPGGVSGASITNVSGGGTNWTVTVATKNCTASAGWTQCTLSFNSGSRTSLLIDLETAVNGAGTIYVDDVFLGVSGGANLLANPGFESGNTVWATNAAGTWSILQNP